MYLKAGDRATAEKSLEQVNALPLQENMHTIWELASELASESQYDWAISLMEQIATIDKPVLRPIKDRRLYYCPATNLHRSNEKSKPILDECWAELKKQTLTPGDFNAAQTCCKARSA